MVVEMGLKSYALLHLIALALKSSTKVESTANPAAKAKCSSQEFPTYIDGDYAYRKSWR